MTPTASVETLAALPVEQLDRRVAAISERVQERILRARDEERDLTPGEQDLTWNDRTELSALKDAIELRSRRDEDVRIAGEVATRSQQIDAAITRATGRVERAGVPPLLPSQRQFADIRSALTDDPRPLRFETELGAELHTRAVVTLAGDAGVPVGTLGPPSLPEPRRIATAAGIRWNGSPASRR